MGYQSKTTMVAVWIGRWKEESDCAASAAVRVAQDVSVYISSLCKIDILNFSYIPIYDEDRFAKLTLIYVNNGLSIEAISNILKQHQGKKTRNIWMMEEADAADSKVDITVVVRSPHETWD